MQLRTLVRAPAGRLIRWRERQIEHSLRHELAIAAIFREEAPFLDEWIAFHVGVGVTQFYLYNNFSTDDFNSVLRPWIERGFVTLTDWPVPVGQLSAYRHALRRARRECRWLALIDVDEFLFSPRMVDVRPILRSRTSSPGVVVWQHYYGSGGHEKRPDQPLTEAYLMRGETLSVKTIVNPRMVYKVGIHGSKYWLGEGKDTTGQTEFIKGRPALDLLRINHYWSRSLQDLEDKIARGDASTPTPRNRDWHFAFEQALNATRDEAILPVARAIRERREL